MIAEMKRLQEAKRRKKLGLPSLEEEQKAKNAKDKAQRQKQSKNAKEKGKYKNMYSALENKKVDHKIKVSKVKKIKGKAPPPPPGPPPPPMIAPPPKKKKAKKLQKVKSHPVKQSKVQPQPKIKKVRSQPKPKKVVKKPVQVIQHQPVKQQFVQQQPQHVEKSKQVKKVPRHQPEVVQYTPLITPQSPQQNYWQQDYSSGEVEDFGIEFPGEQNGKLRFNYATQNIKKSYIFIFERINWGVKQHLEELIFFDKSAKLPHGLEFTRENRHNNKYKKHSIKVMQTYLPKGSKQKVDLTKLNFQNMPAPEPQKPQSQPVYQQKQPIFQQPLMQQMQNQGGQGSSNDQIKECEADYEKCTQLLEKSLQTQDFETCVRIKQPYQQATQLIKQMRQTQSLANYNQLDKLFDVILGPGRPKKKKAIDYKKQLPTVQEVEQKLNAKMMQYQQEMNFEKCIELRDAKTVTHLQQLFNTFQHIVQLVEHAFSLKDNEQVKGYLAKINQKLKEYGC